MNDVQSTLLEMYKDVKNILEENGITFYVHFGTAIGTVRHDGFIPWDDDIDVAVWREDIPLIDKVLSEGLDREKYYYHISSADTHPHVIRKCDDFETSLKERKAPFIDLFPIDRYPRGNLRRKLCNMCIWGDVGSVWAIDHTDSIPLHKIVKWIPGVFERMADRIVEDDSDLTVVLATQFKDYIFPRDYYGKPIYHRFEDTEVPLPEKCHEILTAMFGDYMTPPPEDKRTGAGGFPCGAYKDYLMDRKAGRA
ncbi:MAG: phosphorylcholine transferase LicD [Candidatus Methanomethylophilaceae archaeon]